VELTELVRTKRHVPERTWNIASSAHWYDRDDFWFDVINRDSSYKAAMLDTEDKLVDKVCEAVCGMQQQGIFVALGPGDGAKEIRMHTSVGTPVYVPVDINPCGLVGNALGETRPIHSEFSEALYSLRDEHPKFIYLGSTFSNLQAMDYDLLATIDESMTRGDSMYVSVQTLPDIASVPLLLHQYQCLLDSGLTDRLANAVGVQTGQSFVQFNPVTDHVEIGTVIASVKGTAKEVGMCAGDKLITLVSHKPPSLSSVLFSRFCNRYRMSVYCAEHEVETSSGRYTSTFEGAVLTKV